KWCQGPFAKIFLFSSDPNQVSDSPVSFRQEGRIAIVTNAGRDAVDAAARETNAVCLRTAKSCGSDAPIVGVKSAIRSAGDGVKKRGHRGEREVSRKTIARGVPGDFRCDRGDYARVLCFISHARLRVHWAPGIPCALCFLWADDFCKTRTHRAAGMRSRILKSDAVIARSKATKQSTLTSWQHGLLRGACHRAR